MAGTTDFNRPDAISQPEIRRGLPIIKARAANMVRGGAGTNPPYTIDMFLEDFPQFTNEDADPGSGDWPSIIPETIFNTFLVMANDAVFVLRWGDKWRWAMGMYIAHYATMYFKTYSETGLKPAQLAKTGQSAGLLTQTTFGDVSVTYDVTIMTKATASWGMWNATIYGQMLATEARLIGMGGAFII